MFIRVTHKKLDS